MKITNPFDPRKILFHKETINAIKQGLIPYPVTLEVDLVDGFCNNNCYYCCFKCSSINKIILQNDRILLKKLKNCYKQGTKAVELVGGSEPTLHPELLTISKSIIDMGYDIGIVTNGVLIHRIQSIAKYFNFIRISLDSGNEKVYRKTHRSNAYMTVIRNIDGLISYGVNPNKIGLSYLCLPENSHYKDIKEFVKLAISLCVGYVVFRPAVLHKYCNESIGNTLISIRRLKREYSKKIRIFYSYKNRWLRASNQMSKSGECKMSLLTGIIQADGRVPFCNLYRKVKNYNLGNVYKKDFGKIWLGQKHKKLLTDMRREHCSKFCKADDYWDINTTKRRNTLKSRKIQFSNFSKAHRNFL